MIDTSTSAALGALEACLASELEALAAEPRAAVATVTTRLWPRLEEGEPWVRALSPLTVLYPWLQGESLPAASLARALPYCAAQAWLVLYGFLDDRRIDGQLALSEPELELCASLCERGLARLRQLSSHRRWLELEIAAALDHYRRAQGAGYQRGMSDLPDTTAEPHRIDVAAGLVAIGRIAPLSLAADLGADAGRLGAMRRAYDLLAYGLQWGDDFEDVDEDLERGESNLLLDALRSAGGTGLAQGDDDRVRAELVDLGILDHAVSVAGDVLRRVAAMQRELGCPTLAELVESKLGRFSGFAAAITGARGVAVARELGLDLDG